MARAKKPRALPTYTPEFEAFWRAYPRRKPNPKPEACEEWHRALAAGVTSDQMIAAAQRFAEECRREKVDAVFVPHARTWMHKHRFLDYLEPTPLDAGSPSPSTGSAGSGPPAEGRDGGDDAWGGGDLRLAPLKDELGPVAYRAWIMPLEVRAGGGGHYLILAPTTEIRNHARAHYHSQVRVALGARSLAWEVSTP